MALEFTKKEEGTNIVVALNGRLDTSTAPDFEKFLKENLDGKTDLTLDFFNLKYISSAGLRVILSAQKTMNKQGKMKVIGVNEMIMEVFEATGFDSILTVE